MLFGGIIIALGAFAMLGATDIHVMLVGTVGVIVGVFYIGYEFTGANIEEAANHSINALTKRIDAIEKGIEKLER